MPNYSYTCLACDKDENRIVKIDDRDKQSCSTCGNKLNRTYKFEGSVWSPTKNGGHSS